jgi:GNAT superfamily N-acetyltransferase
VDAELEAALELDRRITRRAAESWVELALGWEVRHPALADVHHLNTLLLPAPLPPEVSAAELTQLTEDRQGDLGHRRFVLDDAQAGERLSAELLDAGWERDRTLYMVLRGDPQAALADPRARAISEEELAAAQRATLAEEDSGPLPTPGLVDRLTEAQRLLRAGTAALGFGAGQGEEIVSHCTLFCDRAPDQTRLALIDNVGTLRGHRRQGLSKAAVSAAIRAAGEWGAELIVLPADADDWPQVFYAGLGFAPVGRQLAFARRRPGRARPGSE